MGYPRDISQVKIQKKKLLKIVTEIVDLPTKNGWLFSSLFDSLPHSMSLEVWACRDMSFALRSQIWDLHGILPEQRGGAVVFRHTWLMLPGTFRDDLAFCLNGGGKSWKIPWNWNDDWGYPYDSGNLQMLSYSLPESNTIRIPDRIPLMIYEHHSVFCSQCLPYFLQK